MGNKCLGRKAYVEERRFMNSEENLPMTPEEQEAEEKRKQEVCSTSIQ